MLFTYFVTLVLLINENISQVVQHTDTGVLYLDPKTQNNDNNNRRLIGNDEFSQSDKQAILDRHNLYRSDTALGNTGSQPTATNMNKLLWDPALAKTASDYSRLCLWNHNSNRKNDFISNEDLSIVEIDTRTISVGENLMATTASESLSTTLWGMDQWYNEHEYYTFNSRSCQSGEQCGHYTQLVWANTRYVGCGYTLCPTMVIGSSTWNNVLYLVCNYASAGNFGGQFAYKTSSNANSQCDECDNDRICNLSEGLCGGCPSPWKLFCSDYYSNCNSFTSSCISNNCNDNLQSNSVFCTGCRDTCSTCTDAMDTPPCNCDDGTGRTITCNSQGTTTTTTTTTTKNPTNRPTNEPTNNPSFRPTNEPTIKPSLGPSKRPTTNPIQSNTQTDSPTNRPTNDPSKRPSNEPTLRPTSHPSKRPTSNPVTTQTTTTTTTTLQPTNNPIQSSCFCDGVRSKWDSTCAAHNSDETGCLNQMNRKGKRFVCRWKC